MSRYIDADALKKRMLGYYDCVSESTSKENYKGETLMNYEVADMIEDCIDNAPAVEWISVEERLPEKDGLYIIVGRSGTPHAAHYYTGKNGFSNPYATHWMPMPEPPKEG